MAADMENVDYAVADGVAEVTLDRPEVLNAMDERTLAELTASLEDAIADDSVYVIVLTGSGRGFCSGADTSGLSGRTETSRTDYGVHLWRVQTVNRLLYDGPKPTIAAVNGPAIGAGCDFALACDLRVMSTEAFLRQQFINVGLIPGDGGGWFLPRLVGESKAKEYVLTGRDITPDAAEDLGLVVEVVEPDDLAEAVRDLAVELRDKPALAMRNCKALFDWEQSFEDYAFDAFERQWECLHDPEQSEALAAVREGRDPEYDRQY